MGSKIMKRNTLWLFLVPLVVPLSLVGVQRWRNSQVANYNVGGHKSEITAERVALKKVREILDEGRDSGTIRVDWDVFKRSKDTTQHPTKIWLYGLFYDQQNKQLLFYTLSPYSLDPRQAQATRYENVTSEIIRSTSNSNGILQDLIRYGAKVTQHGNAQFDEKEGLVFR